MGNTLNVKEHSIPPRESFTVLHLLPEKGHCHTVEQFNIVQWVMQTNVLLFVIDEVRSCKDSINS